MWKGIPHWKVVSEAHQVQAWQPEKSKDPLETEVVVKKWLRFRSVQYLFISYHLASGLYLPVKRVWRSLWRILDSSFKLLFIPQVSKSFSMGSRTFSDLWVTGVSASGVFPRRRIDSPVGFLVKILTISSKRVFCLTSLMLLLNQPQSTFQGAFYKL